MSETSATPLGTDGAGGAPEKRLSVPEALVQLTRAVELVKRFEIDAYEHRTEDDVRRELLPTMRKIMVSAAKLVETIGAYYGDVEKDNDEFEFAVEDTEALGEESPYAERDAEIAGLAYVGKLEIVQGLQQIREPLEGVGKEALIIRCIAARGSVFKVAAAIDKAVCEREGWSRTVRSDPDVLESLIVRRVYCRLAHRLTSMEPPAGENAGDTISEAAAALAEVLAPEVQRHLRMSDRFQLLQLQSRVDAWLAEPDGGDLDAGVRLWQDLTIAAELLMQINNRQELVTHDLATARRLTGRLEGLSQGGIALDPDLFGALFDLVGRDPALDRWVHELEDRVRGELVELVRGIAEALAPEPVEETDAELSEDDIVFI